MGAREIAIVDSGGANIASVIYALERLDVTGVLTKDPDVIAGSPVVILPGVGAAGDAMEKLQAAELVECLRSLTQPVMGICLGMQLLFDHSAEGDVDMLGLMTGELKRFPDRADLIVPHMGWNNIDVKTQDHPLTKNLGPEDYFYFVHSYFAPVADTTLASCTYDHEFTAMTANDNFMGCQFHPERSGASGHRVLQNFVEIAS